MFDKHVFHIILIIPRGHRAAAVAMCVVIYDLMNENGRRGMWMQPWTEKGDKCTVIFYRKRSIFVFDLSSLL